jgi:hypothetical protein
MLTGRCQCGRVAVLVDGEPRDVHYCHCGMCRRAVGGAFATLVWCRTTQVRWTINEPEVYRSSSIAQRGFCAQRGTPTYLAYDRSEQIALMLGLFDQPQTLVPSHHYGVESRLPWVDIGPGLPSQPTSPHPRPTP